MSLIKTVEHAYAVASQDIVKSAKFVENSVLPLLQQAQTNASTIEAITALVSPQAANVERTAFSVLGTIIKAIEDANTAASSGGVNITLDAALVADVKSIIPAVKGQATVTAQTVAKQMEPQQPQKRSWFEILTDNLSTEGGNIFVLFLLIILIGVFVILKFEHATEQLYFVLGALTGILKGRFANKE